MSRNKADVKHERIIRGLSKLDDNRKCLNCGSLGPQYISTTFSTFVCMACSGVHREFNHRVKSISLSKFSAEEVAALQAGGNQRALERYFKHWDSRHLPVPDSSNFDKLRDFIKAVYVDQLYAANKPPPPPPKEDEHDTRRTTFRPGFLTSHSFDDRRPSTQRETHQRTRSEDRPSHRDDDRYSPPVRSMREILGDDLPSLRIEPANSVRDEAEQRDDSQEQYVKASTTGWATFDTAPAAPANYDKVEPWQNFRPEAPSSVGFAPPQEPVAGSSSEDFFASTPYHPYPIHQFVPEVPVHRKSINPFDLTEDNVDTLPHAMGNPGVLPSSVAQQVWLHPSDSVPYVNNYNIPSEFNHDIQPPSRPGNPFC